LRAKHRGKVGRPFDKLYQLRQVPNDILAKTGNPLLEKLRRGELVTAMMIRSARTPDVVRVAAATGHDSIIVDLEHSTMSFDVVAGMTAVAHDLGLAPFVRVPERDYGSIGRVLDGGACGIVVARIETAEQAREVARACRFAPLGQRSQIAMVPQLGFRPTSASELNPLLDRAIVVQILIETPLGIANANAIAAVDGVDMLAIGANDLSAELGAPGKFRNAAFHDGVARVAAACRRHGKLCVLGGVSDLSIVSELLPLGVAPLMMTGSDIDVLFSAALARVEALAGWHAKLPEIARVRTSARKKRVVD
jgi:2-keto-3-deoxy-L-rhamnonate aldolase RhmA